ncbi:MAG TPA: MFS transporter [Chitinophagaceae bacterium]|nr:MFS transporter [Chitinophagaceae bacterium]
MNKSSKVLSIPVLVAALGYFVDIYDLVLFSIVRKKSLLAIGVSESNLEKNGLWLLNIQMIGMLVGGLIWGIIGDKKGRLSVLFGSIIMYSVANILNGFVTDITQYGILRFIAGVGLAGELGAGITLVSEILHKDQRGWGTTIVATVGVSGALLAGFIGVNFDWTTSYFVGGGLGLILLIMRFGVFESGMYKEAKESTHEMGSLKMLFMSRSRMMIYLKCIFVGLPIWYCIGILITLSPELGKELDIIGEIKPAYSIMYCYAGVTLGDLTSGIMSQLMKSRVRVLQYYVFATLIMVIAYFFMRGATVQQFYILFAILGFAAGYWAVLITTASEQFGTNIRATVTTSVPNFIRASLVPISLLYGFFQFIGIHKLNSALFVGIICCVIAFIAASLLKETHGKDLDYYEK